MEKNSAQLEISREFNCSKESLYDAWTAPDQLRQWWKPMGKELRQVENDVITDGNLKYVFDEHLLIEGKYEKVTRAENLEYSWNWHLQAKSTQDASYTLSVQFNGDRNHSSISITQHGFNSEAHIQPHQSGWEQALDQLGEFINRRHLQDDSSITTNGAPDSGGYNETPEQQKVGGG